MIFLVAIVSGLSASANSSLASSCPRSTHSAGTEVSDGFLHSRAITNVVEVFHLSSNIGKSLYSSKEVTSVNLQKTVSVTIVAIAENGGGANAPNAVKANEKAIAKNTCNLIRRAI